MLVRETGVSGDLSDNLVLWCFGGLVEWASQSSDSDLDIGLSEQEQTYTLVLSPQRFTAQRNKNHDTTVSYLWKIVVRLLLLLHISSFFPKSPSAPPPPPAIPNLGSPKMTSHLPTGAAISRSTTPSTFSQPTHSADGKLLPGILMLHGGGSNATVFKIQSRRLIWNLSKQFRFVFAQAPIEGTPGFGMLPVFASCAPFYRWVNRRFVAGESDVEATPRDEIDAVDERIRAVMDENGGVESFKGVIGFSQGARLVAGLLLRQKIQERDLGTSPWKFSFGVMIGGPFPPIAMAEVVHVADYELLRHVPTVHAWGRDDHVKPGCVALREACESDVCFQMDFEGGHHLPLKDVEAKDLCDLINAAWFAGGGTYGISAEETY